MDTSRQQRPSTVQQSVAAASSSKRPMVTTSGSTPRETRSERRRGRSHRRSGWQCSHPIATCCAAASRRPASTASTLGRWPTSRGGASPVCLAVRVRHLRCVRSTCPRALFAERLDGLVAPNARRPTRLSTALTRVGMALGGEVRVQLLLFLGVPRDAPASGPPRADAGPLHAARPRGGRLGPLTRPHLRHAAGGPGATGTRRAPARP